MTNHMRFLTIAIIFLFTLGVAMPQPAHAGLWDLVKSAVSSVADTAKSAVSGAIDTVKNVASTAVEIGKQAYETVKNGVKDLVGSITGAGSSISGAVSQAAGSVGSAVSRLSSGLGGAVGGALNALQSLGSKPAELANNLKDTISKATEIFSDKGKDLFEQVKDSIDKFKAGVFDGNKLFEDGDLAKTIDKYKNMLVDGLKDPSKLLSPEMAENLSKNPVLNELMEVGKGLAAKGQDLLAKGMEAYQNGKEYAGKLLGNTGKAISESDFMKKAAEYGQKFSDLVTSKADAARFNKQYGEIINTSSENGGTRTSALMSVAGLDVAVKNNVDGQARGVLGAADLTTKVDAHLGLKLDASASHKGENFEVSAATRNVVGLSAYGEGTVRWMDAKSGTLASASGNATVAAGAMTSNELSGKVQLSENYGAKANVVVNGLAGADASVKGNAYIGRNGIALEGGAEARAGLWADAAGSTSVTYKGQNLFTASGTAGAGLGVGAGVKGGASFRTDRVGFNASVTLGPVKLGGGVYVNPQAVAQVAWDKGKQAGQAIGNAASRASSWVRSWFD